MDENTTTYLDKKFEGVATKEDITSVTLTLKEDITSVTSTLGDVVTLMDKRFNGVDKRFDKVEERLDTIEEKLDPLVNQVSGHEKRVAFLEDKVL